MEEQQESERQSRLESQRIEESQMQVEINNAFSDAWTLAQFGDYESAITSLLHLISLYPEDSRGYEYLAGVYYAQGAYDSALAILDAGTMNVPEGDFTDLYNGIGRDKSYNEKLAAARQSLQDGVPTGGAVVQGGCGN